MEGAALFKPDLNTFVCILDAHNTKYIDECVLMNLVNVMAM